MYDDTIQATATRLHRRTTGTSDLLYIAEERNGEVQPDVMYHLSCFAGGMYALSALTTANATLGDIYARDAAAVTRTCHESYIGQPSGLGPEAVQFSESGIHATDKDGRYQLRPETIESYFYMWR